MSVMMGRGPRSEPWGTPVGDNEIYLGYMSGGLSGQAIGHRIK